MKSYLAYFVALAGITALAITFCAPARRDGRQGIRTTENTPFEITTGSYDHPSEASAYFLTTRVVPGESETPVERYLSAMRHVTRMPRYSTALRKFVAADDVTMQSIGSQSVAGTWVSLGPGNVGGRTRAIIVSPRNPATIFAAGVSGGIWKTTDAGALWVPLNDLLPSITVCSLAMDPSDPDTIYAGTGEWYTGFRGAGVFKTTNGGFTWLQLASTANPNFFYVNDIVVSQANTQRVYAATSRGPNGGFDRYGIYRSDDGGFSWTQVLNVENSGCYDLAIRTDQGTDYVLAACGLSPTTVYRTTNGGGVWTPVLSEPEMGRTSLAISPSNQNVVYALSASNSPGFYAQGLHAVFRSTDGGSTWAARVRNTDPVRLNTKLLSSSLCSDAGNYNQGFYDNVIAVDPLDSNRVWAGGPQLFRSDDGGANWNIADKLVHPDHHAIVFHPQYNGTTNSIVFSGNDGGVYATEGGRTPLGQPCADSTILWTSLNHNYAVTQFYHGLPYPDGKSYLGGTQDNGTVRGTDKEGINGWKEVFGGDGGYVAIDPTDPDIIYVGHQYGLILKSKDAGLNFDVAMDGIDDPYQPFVRPFIMDPTNPNRLWTSGKYVWRTDDAARHWVRAGTFGPLDYGPVRAIAIAPTDPNKLLVGLFGPIARTNLGLSAGSDTIWQLSFVSPSPVTSVAFDPTNVNIAYATYGSFNTPGYHHVYKSTDSGVTWSGIDGSGVTSLPDIPINSIVVDPTNTARLYVGTDLGVFVSLDAGRSWALEHTGFPNVITQNLAVVSVGANTTLFAFTHGRGVWRVKLSGPSPEITAASVGGKKLFITGTNFDDGAIVLLNGEEQKTRNDSSTMLVATKAGKMVRPGDTLQVRNSDGDLSNQFRFSGQ